MALKEQDIINQLNKLISFLDCVYFLVNSHLSSFFTDNLWTKNVPPEIQSELNNLNSVNNFIEFYPKIVANNCPNKFAKDHPNLLKFINTALNISVLKNDQYVEMLNDLEVLISNTNYSKKSEIEMEEFMSLKKFHEVKITSKMTEFLSNVTESSHVVDIGGGKGYLSCILALHYSFKVLGLESSEVTTCGALKRSEKVAKLWTGEVVTPSGNNQKSNKKDREQFVQKHYRQIINFVKPDTDIEHLLKESFSEEIAGVTLTGLHTCGDLASTCLKMFLTSKKIKGIINIGCCYNHLSEEFESDGLGRKKEKETCSFGFPLSRHLKNKNYLLGRNARMLAAHSVERINQNSEFEFSQTSIFYRAVLETVKKTFDGTSDSKHVGRLAKKCSNFHEYMFTALKKSGINSPLTENDFDKLHESYIDKKPFLTAFYLLRISLAPVVESIILLDRVLYLIENDINHVYLVPLFNFKISPRGFGIIAWKDLEKS